MPRIVLLALFVLSAAVAGCIKYEDPPPVSEEPTAAVEGTAAAGVLTEQAGETAPAAGTGDAVRTAASEETAAVEETADAAGTAESAGTESALETSAAPTEPTADPYAPTATPITATPMPAATWLPPAATVPPLIYPTRIDFAPGAESATVSGALAAGGDRVGYVLRALEGQTLRILLSDTPPGQIVIDVRGADGVPLGADATGAGLAYALEKTQDYLVALATTTGAPATSYSMTVYISALEDDPTPERIDLALGSESATVSGNMASGGDSAAYVLRALAGQTLRIFVTGVPATPIRVVVRDPAGALLPGSVEGAGWSHDLPETGDYTITLATAPGAPAARYSLTIYIAAPDIEPPPIRIEFMPGAESATVTGGLCAGGGSQRYLLRALEAQTMQVLLGSLPFGEAEVEVWGPSGQYIGVVPDGPSRAFDLPETGDYVLSVRSGDGAAATSYMLTAYIAAPESPVEPERIEFEPGAVSAAVAGSLPAGGGERAYVLRALAGQDMHISVANTPAGPIMITAIGPGGDALPGAAGWAGTSFSLPATGDYTLRLAAPPGSPAMDYTMTVAAE